MVAMNRVHFYNSAAIIRICYRDLNLQDVSQTDFQDTGILQLQGAHQVIMNFYQILNTIFEFVKKDLQNSFDDTAKSLIHVLSTCFGFW